MTVLLHSIATFLDVLAAPPALIGSIGTPEILIILAIALIVLGPGKLPEVAKKLGKGLRELRRATDDLRGGFYEDVRDVRRTFREAEDAALGKDADDAAPPPEGPPADEAAARGAAARPAADHPEDGSILPADADAGVRPADHAVPIEVTSSRPGRGARTPEGPPDAAADTAAATDTGAAADTAPDTAPDTDTAAARDAETDREERG